MLLEDVYAVQRFAWEINPRNYLLLACHAANETVQLNQLRRWYGYHYGDPTQSNPKVYAAQAALRNDQGQSIKCINALALPSPLEGSCLYQTLSISFCVTTLTLEPLHKVQVQHRCPCGVIICRLWLPEQASLGEEAAGNSVMAVGAAMRSTWPRGS